MNILWHALADALVLLHLAFVIFVLAGALLVAVWPRLAWLHLPAVGWGILVEVNGWLCPLTPWEQALRRHGGAAPYAGGFVEHYIVPILYPSGLTVPVQWTLAGVVVVCNAMLYAWLWRRRRLRRSSRL